ncbi:hypothetical protein [Proteiniclasticum sp.]|uniref:hypothetical protein n=1 Tax=Proteiniclasticum sp. TaxID=2053595 RepID=UPI00289742A4|nr:hypothetical protein [Proteiniclasticum sp.]
MDDRILSDEALDFLLSSDPCIIYQTRKYLLEEDVDTLRELQKQTLIDGFGKRFLSHQNDDYTFGKSDYVGKWTSTHYTLLDLRYLEIPRDTKEAMIPARNIFLQHRASDGGIAISSDKKSDVCVNGMTLNFSSYFLVEEDLLKPLVDNLLEVSLSDGGYNCRYNRNNVRHSSMHSTISVLEGFLEYERNGYTYRLEEIKEAAECASQFILQHNLFRSDHTGEIIDHKFLNLAFPTRWKYDIHRALYYFMDRGFPYDKRMEEALIILKEKQHPDGTFSKGITYSGELHFPLEEGRRGHFNTLRCLRILNAYGEFLR